MNKNIVIDTNVLISALLFSGTPNKVFDAVIDDKYELFLSHDILNEFLHVLSRPKFQLSPSQITEFYEEIIHITNIVYPQKQYQLVKEDPDDDILFDCALEANAHFIITGNKHVLKIKKFMDVEVLTPKQFIELSEAD